MDLQHFHNVLFNFSLIDMRFKGCKFMWTNRCQGMGLVYDWYDIFLDISSWYDLFLTIKIHYLVKYVFDNAFIVLNIFSDQIDKYKIKNCSCMILPS